MRWHFNLDSPNSKSLSKGGDKNETWKPWWHLKRVCLLGKCLDPHLLAGNTTREIRRTHCTTLLEGKSHTWRDISVRGGWRQNKKLRTFEDICECHSPSELSRQIFCNQSYKMGALMDFATFFSKAEEKLKNELISCTIMPNSFYEQHNRILLAMRCLVVLSRLERRKKWRVMPSFSLFLPPSWWKISWRICSNYPCAIDFIFINTYLRWWLQGVVFLLCG